MTVTGAIFDPDIELIRVRFKDGKYSVGGSYGARSKKGKVWVGQGPFHNHLNILFDQVVYDLKRHNAGLTIRKPWKHDGSLFASPVVAKYEGAVIVFETPVKRESDFTTYFNDYFQRKGLFDE